MAPPGNRNRSSVTRRNSRGTRSDDWRLMTDSRLSFLLVLDVAANDVGDIGVFFFLLLDEGGIVESLIHLDLFFDIGLGGLDRSFRPLRLGFGVFERDEFGLLRLGRDDFLGRSGSGRAGCGHRRRLWARARGRQLHRHDLAGIGRDHGILVEIVEFASGFGTDAFGAKFRFAHGGNPSIWVLHLASRGAPVNSGLRLSQSAWGAAANEKPVRMPPPRALLS